MHKMSATMHKSMPAKVVTYLKDNRPVINGSTDHKKNQNEPTSSSRFGFQHLSNRIND